MHALYLTDPGERPAFRRVAYHLWGENCDFDSDGNDDHPPPDGWTELTVTLRPQYDQRVDIDPLDMAQPLVLAIRSEDKQLAIKAALYLQSYSGGVLSDAPPSDRSNGS